LLSSGNHVLTVDVEDWYHICGIGEHALAPSGLSRVRSNVEKLLSLLDIHKCKATFFMLGSVAESDPELAPAIFAKGHEIASHGYSHRLLPELSEHQFLEELLLTERILTEQTGKRPIGFRAPQWSVSSKTPWIFNLLAENGYIYDSSCNPLPFIGGNALNRHPYMIATPHGTLWELPPLVTPLRFINLPVGGGWGFRLFPMAMIKATIKRYEREQAPAVFYLHPRELDPEGPRLPLAPLKKFVSYGMRTDASPRLSLLMERFRFTTLESLVTEWLSAS